MQVEFLQKDTEEIIEEAKKYGIDITILLENLKLTPTERIRKYQNILEFVEALKKANKKKHGKS
jgi:CMP-N-acetylneuraminic acid synthetase